MYVNYKSVVIKEDKRVFKVILTFRELEILKQIVSSVDISDVEWASNFSYNGRKKNLLKDLKEKLDQNIIAISDKQIERNKRLMIKTRANIIFVSVKNLLHIQAEENGCRYFLKGGNSIWNDEKLKSWEEKLDPILFVRIHRSTIVQKEYISKISYDKLRLNDGTELKIGRKYKQNL